MIGDIQEFRLRQARISHVLNHLPSLDLEFTKRIPETLTNSFQDWVEISPRPEKLAAEIVEVGRVLHAGHAVVVRSASDLLADLIKQESSEARARRLAAYVRAHLLCIDEVGYLSYDARHADLLFEVGSVGKTFVTTLLMQLVDEGVVSLDDPLSRWISGHPRLDPRITLRELVASTSGASVSPYALCTSTPSS